MTAIYWQSTNARGAYLIGEYARHLVLSTVCLAEGRNIIIGVLA